MDVSPKELIKAYFDAAQDDPSILASLVTARTAALTGMLSKGGGNTLNNSQKNGISYSVLVSLPETTRLTVLNRAIFHIKNNMRPSSRTFGNLRNTPNNYDT